MYPISQVKLNVFWNACMSDTVDDIRVPVAMGGRGQPV